MLSLTMRRMQLVSYLFSACALRDGRAPSATFPFAAPVAFMERAQPPTRAHAQLGTPDPRVTPLLVPARVSTAPALRPIHVRALAATPLPHAIPQFAVPVAFMELAPLPEFAHAPMDTLGLPVPPLHVVHHACRALARRQTSALVPLATPVLHVPPRSAAHRACRAHVPLPMSALAHRGTLVPLAVRQCAPPVVDKESARLPTHAHAIVVILAQHAPCLFVQVRAAMELVQPQTRAPARTAIQGPLVACLFAIPRVSMDPVFLQTRAPAQLGTPVPLAQHAFLPLVAAPLTDIVLRLISVSAIQVR